MKKPALRHRHRRQAVVFVLNIFMAILYALFLVFLVTGVVLTFAAPAHAEDTDPFIEVTYFAHATHKPFIDENKVLINNKLNLFSVAYRNEKHGAAVITFTNSYFKRAVAVSYLRYWHPADHIETAVNVGLTTGYDSNMVLFAPSVAYTKYDFFVPKVSWFGQAFIFSLSANYRF